MSISLYLQCFVVALVGMALQTTLKIKGLQDKAVAANVQFKISDYFKKDWLSILAAILTIILFLLFVDNILKWRPGIVDYAKIGFAFVGWTGGDAASRLFGVVDKKINQIINDKSNQADGSSLPTTPLK